MLRTPSLIPHLGVALALAGPLACTQSGGGDDANAKTEAETKAETKATTQQLIEQLGARSGLIEHLAFDQPVGCMIVDDAATEIPEVPVACTMGYSGGAAAMATDLGSEGKEADAEGHVAHYLLQGNDIYLDDLDEINDRVVITNHPALLAKAKGYLVTNMLGRADSITDDVEFVAYPKAAMVRYSKELDSLLSMARSVPQPSMDNPFLDAFTEYSRTSMDHSFDYYREIDQFDMGMGLEALGFAVRFAMYPTPGSGTQADMKTVSKGPIDSAMATQLPAESWLVSAYSMDWEKTAKLESSAAMRNAMIGAYATAVGRDAAEVKTSIESFFEENAGLYGDDVAMAVVHLPGTQGGMILSQKLDSPARDKWTPWTEGFTPERVLGPEGIKFVTWSFQADALEVDGVAVDRWTVEPGPETLAKIAEKKDPVVAEFERRFGGLKLVIDRVELADRVLFVVAPGSAEQYIHAAIEATKSGGLGSDEGFKDLLARNPGSSGLMALDVAGALGWAREVLPPEATRKIPSGLGNDLGDFAFSVSYGASGTVRGEMVLSQGMIDGLRKLAE
jgi:hypothetical protein